MKRTASIWLSLAVSLGGCVSVPEPVVSWGKPCVSYADYRSESIACAVEGVSVDVAATVEYGDVKRGLDDQYRTLESLQGDTYDRIRDYSMTYQRNIRGNVESVQALMVSRTHACLRGKNYMEFILTATQARRFSELKKGTDARFRYLHSLASDPDNMPPDLPDSFNQ